MNTRGYEIQWEWICFGSLVNTTQTQSTHTHAQQYTHLESVVLFMNFLHTKFVIGVCTITTHQFSLLYSLFLFLCVSYSCYTYEFYFYLALRLLCAVFHLRHFDHCSFFFFVVASAQVFLILLLLLFSSFSFTTGAYVRMDRFRLNQKIDGMLHKWKWDGMLTKQMERTEEKRNEPKRSNNRTQSDEKEKKINLYE